MSSGKRKGSVLQGYGQKLRNNVRINKIREVALYKINMKINSASIQLQQNIWGKIKKMMSFKILSKEIHIHE